MASSGRALHIGRLPGRKQVCLYVNDVNHYRPLAYFKTEKAAREAMKFIDSISRLGFEKGWHGWHVDIKVSVDG